MSDIPTELYHEILLQVPTKQLLRCRRVCKRWRSIIDSPDFTKLHLKSQIGADDMLMVKGTNGRLFSMSLSSLNHPEPDTIPIEGFRIRNVTPQGVPRDLNFPAASCHGLVLVTFGRAEREWLIWNPLTGFSREVPTCKNFVGGDSEKFHWGLGYDDSTSDYKVVRVSNVEDDMDPGPYHLKTLIYSLKSNKWHRINDLPNFRIPVPPEAGLAKVGSSKVGLYFNGTLHWAVDDDQGRKCAISLDLSTETYHTLPLPSCATDETGVINCTLVALSVGLIWICYDPAECWFDVWVMKDDNKWTRLITFQDHAILGHDDDILTYTAVAYLEDTKQLVVREQCYGKCVRLDLDTRTAKEICIKGIGKSSFGNRFDTQVFPASLIKLDGMAIASKGARKRKRKRKTSGIDNVKFKVGMDTHFYFHGIYIA